MNAYGNVHLALEAMRIRALNKTKSGQAGHAQAYGTDGQDAEPPRVLILGPENSGKTTLAKILLNYTTRAAQNWCPMLVNVDPSEVHC
jgi:polyribonucleotide 5'-hydroxyl-kinase